jgi:hypothetical protein
MPVMLLAVLLAALWINRRFPGGHAERLGVGLVALGLLLAAELVVGMTLRGASLAGALVNRDPVTGTLYYASLGVFAFLPWILASRFRSGG